MGLSTGDILVRIELTAFFERNPHTFENAEGLAIRIGRDARLVQEELARLVETGIIERIGVGDRAIFRYRAPNVMNVGTN